MGSYSSRLTMSKWLCHKSPKDKAVFQLIRDFIFSTSALGCLCHISRVLINPGLFLRDMIKITKKLPAERT